MAFSMHLGGKVSPIFHRDSDYRPGGDATKAYYCLTRGFVLDSPSGLTLSFVNDMTISTELDLGDETETDWFHVLSDDSRLLELVRHHCDPSQSPDGILAPLAALFHTEIQQQGRLFRVIDNQGSLIALSHSFFCDRKRICELVTSPLCSNHKGVLEMLVQEALRAGCTVPAEAAFHIHFEGATLCSTSHILRLIRCFFIWGPTLKRILPPNPHCRRLGDYPQGVIEYAFERANETCSWEETKTALKDLGLNKYCDFNLVNLLRGDNTKLTVEIRAIPMILDADALFGATQFYFGVLQLFGCMKDYECMQSLPPTDENIRELLCKLEAIEPSGL